MAAVSGRMFVLLFADLLYIMCFYYIYLLLLLLLLFLYYLYIFLF